jgi:hypothetical protein
MVRKIWYEACGLQDMDLIVWMAKSNSWKEKCIHLSLIGKEIICLTKAWIYRDGLCD